MAFQANIDNDSVAMLPAARFPGRIVVVDNDDMVDAACEDLQRHERIGFDTETRPSFRAGVSYKVSLLQLSTPDTCYLFRLCKIRLSNRILKILGSRRILKVGADVSGDIRQLRELREFNADGFVDLQHEASRWGIEEKSLRKLSAIVLGERVSKELHIPTIGIGAGGATDGQVLVAHDMLGITQAFSPRFLRRYADLGTVISEAVGHYVDDVKSRDFPNEKEQY